MGTATRYSGDMGARPRTETIDRKGEKKKRKKKRMGGGGGGRKF